jgi:hypothetical protein
MKNNLESILKHGLIPKIGDISRISGETIERIYMFPDEVAMENAVCTWLGDYLDQMYGDAECCVLELNLPDDFPITSGDAEYELCSKETIPPQYIKLFREI